MPRERPDKYIVSVTVVMSHNRRAVGSGAANMVWRHTYSAATMEHVLPSRPHQGRASVFCSVRAGAIYGELKHKPISPS